MAGCSESLTDPSLNYIDMVSTKVSLFFNDTSGVNWD